MKEIHFYFPFRVIEENVLTKLSFSFILEEFKDGNIYKGSLSHILDHLTVEEINYFYDVFNNTTKLRQIMIARFYLHNVNVLRVTPVTPLTSSRYFFY